MSYKFEMHSHTSNVSYCSHVTPAEAVRLFKAAGYDGITITNHYYDDWFITNHEIVKDCKNMRERIEKWLQGFILAKEEGDKIGITVILGAELRLTSTGINDYLLLGGDENFYLNTPCLYSLTPEQVHSLAQKNCFYFGQVHPCRDGCHPVNTEYLDGMEVFNGHPTANNHCDITYDIIKKSSIITTVGTDFHEKQYVNRAAILLPECPDTAFTFAQMLLNNKIDGYLIKSEYKNNPDLPFLNDSRFSCI